MFGIWGGFCCSISSGLLTAVLVNHWLDDSAAGDGPARLLSLLGGHFNLVLQSCRSGHKVPEPAMFSSALQHLGVTSQQVDCIYICLSVTITVYPGRFQREYQCSMFSCPSDFRLCGWMQTRKVWRQQREQGWRPSWWKIWMTLWANWPTLLGVSVFHQKWMGGSAHNWLDILCFLCNGSRRMSVMSWHK